MHVEASQTNNKADFDNIGIVCVSGGCNTTKIKPDKNDTVQTDVIVHVQTKIDLNQNKSKEIISDRVEDAGDVPIVVGYGGTKSETLVPQTLIVPDKDNSEPILPSTNIDLEPPLINSRSDTFEPNNIYLPPSNGDGVDIKIKTMPAITVTMSTDNNNFVKDVRYKTNGIELRVPYFEPTYNKHYFGEQQPQFVWYTRKQTNFNPVEFRNVQKSAWNPSIWNVRTPIYHKHTTTTANTATAKSCSCKNQGNEGITTNLNWYPNINRRISPNDPGSQINDKLAPLN